MRYQTTLIGQVYDHVASAMPARYILVSIEESKARSLMLSVKTIEGKRGGPFPLSPRSGNGHGCRHAQVTIRMSWLVNFKLGGRAREWALTCNTSVDAAFLTWDSLTRQMSRVLASPN